MAQKLLSARRWPLAQPALLLYGLALGSFVWAYWPTFSELADNWSRNPQYSHGYLIPGLALILLVVRWNQGRRATFQSSLWGLPCVLAGVALHLAGAYFYYTWFEIVSLVPCLLGLCLLAGGWG